MKKKEKPAAMGSADDSELLRISVYPKAGPKADPWAGWAVATLCCVLAVPMASAALADQGGSSSGSLGVSVVILPHCFEFKSSPDQKLAALLESKGLLCAASSGIGTPARLEQQPDGSLRIVPGEPNTFHRAGTT